MKIIISCFFTLLFSISVHAEVSYTSSSEAFTQAIERYVVDLENSDSSDMVEVAPIDYGYSEWEEYGEPYDCTFTPSVETVLKGEVFDQVQACLAQERRYKYTYEYAVLTKTEEEFRYVDAERVIEAVGILTFSYVDEYTAWSNIGSVYSCSGYSPSTSTVNSGVTFTQTRSCSQSQQRTKFTYKVNDITGARELSATGTESKVISVGQSRQATGTKAVGGHWRLYGIGYGPFHLIMGDLLGMGGSLKNVIEGTSCSTLGEIAGMLVLTGMTEYRLTTYRCQ